MAKKLSKIDDKIDKLADIIQNEPKGDDCLGDRGQLMVLIDEIRELI